jgi:hypothetical protein
MDDGRTLHVVWTEGHGGVVRFLSSSLDGGLSWSDPREDLPSNWPDHANCPAFYRLAGPDGDARLAVFVNRGPQGYLMYRAISDDDGETWSPFAPVLGEGSELPLGAGEDPAPTVMPFTAVVSGDDDRKLLGVTNLRRPGGGESRTNVVAQSYSHDGGESWSDWQIVLDLGDPFGPCEPELIRSPDGSQLTMLVRENRRSFNSWIMHSEDEGRTWSLPRQAPAALSMDRHQHRFTEDGRLIVVGRDTAAGSPTRRHFVAWVGSYEDLVTGGEGLYRIKLLHAHHGQVEYPSLEILPDETLVATNSLVYRPGENYSVVSTRFTLQETDRIFQETIRKTMDLGEETE